MKKTIIAMLAFVFVSISGISYAADKVFALVPKAMNNPFFDLARDGCKVAEKEIGGIECLYAWARGRMWVHVGVCVYVLLALGKCKGTHTPARATAVAAAGALLAGRTGGRR